MILSGAYAPWQYKKGLNYDIIQNDTGFVIYQETHSRV
jgi:hypothetical protein